MIKINLLGNRTGIDHSSKFFLAGYALLFAAAIGICSYAYLTVNSGIDELARDKAGLEADLNTLSTKTKSVKDLDVKRQTLKSKLLVLARLRNNKIGPVRVLDDLNNAVPKEVWISSVNESGGGMTLVGKAITPQDISVFMQNLEKSKYFDVGDLTTAQVSYSKKTGQAEDSGRGRQKQERSGLKTTGASFDKSAVKIQEFTLKTQVYYTGRKESEEEVEK